MKTVQLLLVTALIASISAGAYAQNTFFPTKAGMVLTYVQNDAKGKAVSYTLLTIKNVEGSGNNMTVNYVGQVLDKNRKQVGDTPIEIPYTVTISNGVVEWDMKSFAAPGTEGFIEIEGDKLRIPPSLSPGDKLNDAKFTMTISVGFKIRTEVSLTDQECLAIEDVTVPAGTFKCHKVTQTSAATVMRKTTTTKTISWYTTGIGTVKSETYDSKNKLLSSQELVEIN